MQQKLIRSATILQQLLCSICSTFRAMNPKVAETLFLLHLDTCSNFTTPIN